KLRIDGMQCALHPRTHETIRVVRDRVCVRCSRRRTRATGGRVGELVLAVVRRLRPARPVDVHVHPLLVLVRRGVQLLQRLVQRRHGEDVLSGLRLELPHDWRRAVRLRESRPHSRVFTDRAETVYTRPSYLGLSGLTRAQVTWYAGTNQVNAAAIG